MLNSFAKKFDILHFEMIQFISGFHMMKICNEKNLSMTQHILYFLRRRAYLRDRFSA